MSQLNKNRTVLIILSTLVVFGIIGLVAFQKHDNSAVSGKQTIYNIGYIGSPLLSTLYLAEKKAGWKKNYNLVKFDTSADLGYALLAGKLDAGFIEPNKALLIKGIREFRKIAVIGKVVYPYGGLLIVRKGLNLLVQDLPSHKVAKSSDECKLFHALKKDMRDLNVKTNSVDFISVPFDSMLPALESGAVDAVITKSSYGIYAKKLGFTIPYAQWDITAGDACCPAVVAQTEFLLVTRKKSRKETEYLSTFLLEIQKESDKDLRAAAAEKTGIPLKIVESLPIAAYSLADDKLLKLFISAEEDDEKDAKEGKDGKGGT